MNIKKHLATATIGNALIWAAIMIAGALLVTGSEHANDLLLLNVVGFTMSSTLITRLEKKAKARQDVVKADQGVTSC